MFIHSQHGDKQLLYKKNVQVWGAIIHVKAWRKLND